MSGLVFSVAVSLVASSAGAAPITARAKVDFIEQARVPAQEEGVLKRVIAQRGQEVAAKDVLAEIDDKLIQLQARVAGEELKVAKQRFDDDVSIRYAKKAADVYRADYIRLLQANQREPGVVPEAEVQLAKLRWEQYILQAEKSEYEQIIAGLEMNVSQAKLDAAQEHIQRSRITAPWDGVVTELIRFEGDWVKPGDPILRMVRVNRVRVICGVKIAEHRPQDINGRPVTVRVDLPGATEIFKGTITNTASTVESNNEFLVWADLENRKKDGSWVLLPGMWATMTIEPRQ
ncbi:MAG: HlyD family efflux transporter periplasmic adaptor subunit [Pirellulaceae bacterium]|nr:HlyD family efflux transporter periplasmic adaptor subunit [Pirellulaceae bacterium]